MLVNFSGKWLLRVVILLITSSYSYFDHFAGASAIDAGSVERRSSVDICVGKECDDGEESKNISLNETIGTCGAQDGYCDQYAVRGKKGDNLQYHPKTDANSEEECGIYLAQSTIPFAGLGMFAGKAYKTDDLVTQGDIVIPLSELDWHNGFELDFFLWEEYTWSGTSFPGLNEETDYNGMQGCSTGIGAAVNCMLPLVNIVDEHTKMDNAGLHRSTDPGAGGFTTVHDRTTKATRDIVAGEELYIDYGEHYFSSRVAIYGLMPLSENYEEADRLLKRFDSLLQSLQKKNLMTKKKKPFSTKLVTDLYSLMTDFSFESRTLNALPSNYSDVDYVRREGTAMQHYNRTIQSLDWLKENGQCMDNIYPGRSTLKQAGRGAFAARFIPKGGLVAPAPLIHIKDKEELRMYDVLPEDEDGLIGRNVSSPNHYQLLLNYAFGHPDSTLLFSPYSMFNSLINHASASSEKVNAKIVWAQKMRNPEWMEQPIEDWTHNSHSGLSFDFVATRDIHPHEEIFIDYGIEWDIAWDRHVKNWKPITDNHSPERPYVPAFQLENNPDLIMKTSVDKIQFSHNVKIYLREDYRLMYGLIPSKDDEQFHRCRVISRFYPHNNVEEEPLYLVEVIRHRTNQKSRLCAVKVVELLFNMPRDAFHFVDEPWSRDHQLTWSFRHEMMIPDEIFPEAWKNLI